MVQRVLLIVDSHGGNVTVTPADMRVEAVLVLGDVWALWALEPHASHNVLVLHMTMDATLGSQQLGTRVAHETPILLGDVFLDECGLQGSLAD